MFKAFVLNGCLKVIANVLRSGEIKFLYFSRGRLGWIEFEFISMVSSLNDEIERDY